MSCVQLSARRRGRRRPYRLRAQSYVHGGAVSSSGLSACGLSRGALVAALAAGVVGCGQSAPSPYEVAYNYLSALSGREFGNACALLDVHTREAMVASTGERETCTSIFTRCVPSKSATPSKDQTQLLYANVRANIKGSTATAIVSGTRVASEVGAVTLANERGNWRLTSYGHGLRRCAVGHRGPQHGAGSTGTHAGV
jgi:hypothetical protein